ncbi:hypothetical protein DSO57_1011984 [Entomophthora muscae]|uniref:Uncharacterized protein n=1 Tax=Entomophthora muscae TaxID=34485 RepID=A0ACC2TGN2_9FUNG|nr:hypothetical protein DSO57_1011984 [Entomophthora muscae]
MITIPLSNDEVLAYLLLGVLLVLFLFLAVQLTQWYTASTANPQPTNQQFLPHYIPICLLLQKPAKTIVQLFFQHDYQTFFL